MKHFTPLHILFGVMALVFLFLASTGGLVPRWTWDTDGYLRPWEWAAYPGTTSMWGGLRNPLLGFLLAPFFDNFSLFPTISIGLFYFAIYYLYRRLVEFGVSDYAALALTLPLVISNSVFRYAHDVGAEFPAIILFVYALAELIGFQTGAKRRLWRYAAFMAAIGASYIIRPTFLPFIVIMPFLCLGLRSVKGRKGNLWPTAAIFILAAVPFLLVSSLRYSLVNDFNIVSFGGFNMSGLAASMLNEELITRLAPEHRELAKTILGKREEMVNSGQICPMAIDYDYSNGAEGTRSFRRTARSHFDMLAFNYDELEYKIVMRTWRKADESWVQFNKRMMSFCLDVLRAAPVDYATWVFGASRSAIGTATAHNLPFVVGFIGLISVYGFLLYTSRIPALSWPQYDIPVITLITVFFTFGSGVLMLLVAWPANRYVFTSAIFLPSLIFYLLFRLLAAAQWKKAS